MSNDRKRFIAYFIKHISSLRYVLLKYIAGSSSQIAEFSDLDLLIDSRQLYRFLEIIRAGGHINRINIQQKSFVTYVSIHFDDHTYLELDLINKFDRKGVIYLNAQEVLNNGSMNDEGIRLPSPMHHFEYIMLFYMLNRGTADQKYHEHFATYTFGKRAEIFGYIRAKYDYIFNTLDELLAFKKKYYDIAVEIIETYPENRGINKYFNKIQYLKDLVNDLINIRGITITFSGVDGAGKSTVLEKVKYILQNKYRQKIVVIRHRPSILPILSALLHGRKKAEELSTSKLPRQGTNKNFFSSLARFSYYFMDYVIGQFYVYIRYTLRGYTVLYDRYYFDFIIDARRSNLSLSRNFIRKGYHFIFKPDVNVFLYAEPEIIRQRKQEMEVSDIRKLTDDYRQLFVELGKSNKKRKYISINNVNLDDTLNIVLDEYLNAS